MEVILRPGRPDDAVECGWVCYEAFRAIAEAHGYPPDFPSAASAASGMSAMLGAAGTRSVIAERVGDGAVVGSVFIHDRRPVASIGPITVEPGDQNRGIGRRLMEDVIAWADDQGFSSVRLVQAAYHNRSLSLYASLGFDAREPLSVMQGPPLRAGVPGRTVRGGTGADVAACEELCTKIHGFPRSFEVDRGLAEGSLRVVQTEGRITGYAVEVGFRQHAVAESNLDLEALIDDAPTFVGPGFLLPTRNGEVLRWCLEHGLRIVMPMTLMTTGWYEEPAGAYLPSIGF